MRKVVHWNQIWNKCIFKHTGFTLDWERFLWKIFNFTQHKILLELRDCKNAGNFQRRRFGVFWR
jgi:hypothetical protein